MKVSSHQELGIDQASNPPQVRRDTHSLKEHIHEYFKSRPRMVQSPKEISKWLTSEKTWSDEGLRPRVSNLLRKIVKEEKEAI